MELTKLQKKILKLLNKFTNYDTEECMYVRLNDDNAKHNFFKELKKKCPKIKDTILNENINFLAEKEYISLKKYYRDCKYIDGLRITVNGRNYLEIDKKNKKDRIITIVTSFITTILTSILINLISKII